MSCPAPVFLFAQVRNSLPARTRGGIDRIGDGGRESNGYLPELGLTDPVRLTSQQLHRVLFAGE